MAFVFDRKITVVAASHEQDVYLKRLGVTVLPPCDCSMLGLFIVCYGVNVSHFLADAINTQPNGVKCTDSNVQCFGRVCMYNGGCLFVTIICRLNLI